VTRRRLVRLTGSVLAATFAVVGAAFLIIPGGVLAAFNWAGGPLGLPESATSPFTLYLALAVAYMYVVTVLAWRMGRHPDVRAYPWILVQAKAASALVCLALFAVQDQYLIYLANFAVDGAIAAFVWWVALRTAPPDDGGVAEEKDKGPAVASRSTAAERPR
jgi:hypothetical protein